MKDKIQKERWYITSNIGHVWNLQIDRLFLANIKKKQLENHSGYVSGIQNGKSCF